MKYQNISVVVFFCSVTTVNINVPPHHPAPWWYFYHTDVAVSADTVLCTENMDEEEKTRGGGGGVQVGTANRKCVVMLTNHPTAGVNFVQTTPDCFHTSVPRPANAK